MKFTKSMAASVGMTVDGIAYDMHPDLCELAHMVLDKELGRRAHNAEVISWLRKVESTFTKVLDTHYIVS